MFSVMCHWFPKREKNIAGVRSCEPYMLVIEKMVTIIGHESKWLASLDQANEGIPKEESLAWMGWVIACISPQESYITHRFQAVL